MPVAKKLMVRRAGTSAHRCGSTASTETSSGMRTMRGLDPDRIARPSTWVGTARRVRIAAVRSLLSSAAVSIAYASSRGREVARGKRGSNTAASIAMIAITQTVSISVKPSCVSCGLFIRRGRYVGRGPASTFDAVGAVGGDLVGAVLAGRTVDVGLAPRIVRQLAALEIRAVPCGEPAGRLDECGQAFRRRRITTGVEIEQLERAGEALDLDLRRLHLGVAQIVEHPRADQRHDEADDRDHDEDFDEGEAALQSLARTPACGLTRIPTDAFHGVPSLFFSSDDLIDGKKRGHDRDDQAADHDADGDDRHRADDGDDTVEAALQLGLVEIGDAAGEYRELPGLLADAQHTNRHRRQDRRRYERIGKLAAVADPIGGRDPRLAAAGHRHDVDEDT